MEERPTLARKVHSKASSMAPEDPSILGWEPMDARRSKAHFFDLSPSADGIVGPTSGMFLKKPTLETENKFPVVAL